MGTSTDHRNMVKRGLGVLLVLALLQTGTEAQGCPTGNVIANINENNTVGAVVTTFPDGVTLENLSPQFPFTLEGTNLVATAVLDHENVTRYQLVIGCTNAGGGLQLRVPVIVSVNNLNDNPPTFDQKLYTLTVAEMTPINSLVVSIAADDRDGNLNELTYTLTPASDEFKLESSAGVADIRVAKLLQYDDVKTVQLILTVQDTDPTHTDSTTIDITITDVDNRPPWFKPCDEVVVQGVKICPNTGYRGTVNLGELLPGPLPLTPNKIQAIDGDNGINEPIKYSIISGNDGWFEIGENTGDITVVKAVDVAKTVHMSVMAYQATNTYQFATTSLTIEVVIKSANKPQFEKAQYEATVQGVGGMAMDAADKNEPLKILATDQDYAAAGGINPYIVYSIPGNTDFSLNNGYLFMITDVAAGSYNMEVKAIDTNNTEEATAQLVVEVVKEPTTTAPPTTVSTATPEPTTGKTTVPTPNTTPDITPDITTNQSPEPTTNPEPTSPNTGPSTVETSKPSSNPTTPGTTGPSDPTSDPALTTEGITAHTGVVINPPGGGFTSADMAALGATLGVLLFICIVVIVVFAVKIRKGDSDWKKINEASAFRSSLGPSGQKEGIQFTNEAFQHDDDDKDNKGGPSGGGTGNGTVPSRPETDKPKPRSIPRPPSPIQDDEKEVKPILSKDKSKEDGYKAVWFKEDIDPNAKEEVLIIPDSREDDDDDEDSDGEMKIPKVKFNDADVDSGLGEKLEDSDEEKAMTSSL